MHEFQPTRSLTASFVDAADAPFKVDGITASRDAAQVNVGATLAAARGLSLFAAATGQFSDRESSYGGFAGLSKAW